MKILGIGNALVDLLIRLDSDHLLEVLHLPKRSMQLIDESKYLKIINQVEHYSRTIACGGSAANTVCGVAKMGVDAGYIGKVSNDSYGKLYAEDLALNGVKDIQLFESDIATGCATTFISPEGERTFGTYLGAAATLQTADLLKAHFKGYDYVHVEGYFAVDEPFFESILKMAKQAGCKVSIDMASYNVVRDNLDLFKRLIPQYADLVFANEEEAYEYTGLNPDEAVRELGREVEIAVVKEGPKGSYIYHNGTSVHASAVRANVIDTTGAGDLYAAGFFYALNKGWSMELCGQVGSLLAGNVVEVIGTKMDSQRWKRMHSEIAKLTK